MSSDTITLPAGYYKQLVESHETLTSERNALAAENARLREALRRIIAHTGHPTSPDADLLVGLLASIDRIAWSALQGATP